MKKILLSSLMMLFSCAVMAQTKFTDISVADATAKAKVEKKIVLVMASATW